MSTGADINGSWNRGCLQYFYDGSFGYGTSGPDNNGNVLKANTYIPLDDQANGWTISRQSYSYDSLNRLGSVAEYFVSNSQAESQQSLQSYTYDRWGNRTINPASWGAGINTKQFTVNTANNRLGVPAGQSGAMTYDAAGNLTTDSYSGYGSRTFDANNRIVAAQDSYAGWSYYTYNADGQRVKRKVNNQETWEIYGIDGELLAEYAANGAVVTPQKEYGYREGQLLITAEPSAAQTVSWTNAVGVTVNGNSLTKTAASGWGTAGATSTQSIAAGDGYVELTVPDTTTHRFLGLSNGNSNSDYTDVDFAIHPVIGGTIFIYEGGVSRGTFGSYTTGDKLRVAVEGGVVKYRKNGALLYTSSITPTYPLLVDSALHGTGDTLSNVVISAARLEWLVPDHLGTPRIILDQTGASANLKRHDYLPFGEELPAGTGGRTAAMGYAPGDGVRQQFTSKERDNETGLDYFNARYYGSPQGRFIGADPLMASGRSSAPQSWNRYSYVLNNPLKLIDPSGLDNDDPQKKKKTPPQKKKETPLPKVTVAKTTDPRATNGTMPWSNLLLPNGKYYTGVIAPLTITITDESGKPLPGLTVMENNKVIKATPALQFEENKDTVITDVNGSFEDKVFGNADETSSKVSPQDATKILQSKIETPTEIVTEQTLTIADQNQRVIATAVYQRTITNLDENGNRRPSRDSSGRRVNNFSISVSPVTVSRPKSP